jgi:hypothetical protein
MQSSRTLGTLFILMEQNLIIIRGPKSISQQLLHSFPSLNRSSTSRQLESNNISHYTKTSCYNLNPTFFTILDLKFSYTHKIDHIQLTNQETPMLLNHNQKKKFHPPHDNLVHNYSLPRSSSPDEYSSSY